MSTPATPAPTPDPVAYATARRPAEAAEEQLQAYNAHDVVRFVAAYSPDVECFDLPACAPYLVGRAALAERYAAFFAAEPAIHCRVVHRAVEGAFVIDQEELTGRRDGRTGSCFAIYQVEQGLIRRVWFAKGAPPR